MNKTQKITVLTMVAFAAVMIAGPLASSAFASEHHDDHDHHDHDHHHHHHFHHHHHHFHHHHHDHDHRH